MSAFGVLIFAYVMVPQIHVGPLLSLDGFQVHSCHARIPCRVNDERILPCFGLVQGSELCIQIRLAIIGEQMRQSREIQNRLTSTEHMSNAATVRSPGGVMQ